MTWDESAAAPAELYLELGRLLSESETTSDRLSDAIRFAVSYIAGAEWSSVFYGRPAALHTLASTDPGAAAADELQWELGVGPSFEAQLNYVSATDDLRADARWPELSRVIAERSPARSVLCYRLFLADDKVVAGLTVYSTRAAAFGRDTAAVAALVATHAAGALGTAAARENEKHLQHALISNRDIGTAMGIIMGLHKISRDQAFEMLRLASQQSNRKLVDIAADVVESGTLDPPAGTTRTPRHQLSTRTAEDPTDTRTPNNPTDTPHKKVPAASGAEAHRIHGAAIGNVHVPSDAIRLHRLEALIDALADTITATDVADVFWREGPLAAGANATGLAIVDAAGRRINFVPSSAQLHSQPVRWASIAITDDQPIAEAARTASPLFFGQPDALLSRYPRLQAAQSATGDRSWAIVPLTGPDTPRGVLTLAWPKPRSFTAADKAHIATLGLLCSAALSRALLREERTLARSLPRPGDSAS